MNELISIEKIAQWEKLKALVLDSVSSPITKRVYNMSLNEFTAWFQQMPRRASQRPVRAWRLSLEERRLGSSSIIIRMSVHLRGEMTRAANFFKLAKTNDFVRTAVSPPMDA